MTGKFFSTLLVLRCIQMGRAGAAGLAALLARAGGEDRTAGGTDLYRL
jgi:hypothetical protein